MVLAGGAGARFWPASRRQRPKPFVALLGETTLLRATLERVQRVAPADRTWVVATRDLERPVRGALRGLRRVRLLLEPAGRNTAAAFALAAATVEAADPGALVGFFPSDHHIAGAEPFARTVRAAARAALRADALVLIGIEPTAPEPGYGHLRLGREAASGAHRVLRFIEKPPLARARRLRADRGWLWNSGMLLAPAARVLAETEAWAPELWSVLGPALRRIAAGERVGRGRLAAAYLELGRESFDRVVLERSRRVLCVRGRFFWSDLGSWDALLRHLPRRAGNAVRGEPPVANIDAAGNVVWSGAGRALALLAVEGLVIVDMPDALLVGRLARAQDVRRIVDQLKRRGRVDLT